jgi:hypothetical protein
MALRFHTETVLTLLEADTERLRVLIDTYIRCGLKGTEWRPISHELGLPFKKVVCAGEKIHLLRSSNGVVDDDPPSAVAKQDFPISEDHSKDPVVKRTISQDTQQQSKKRKTSTQLKLQRKTTSGGRDVLNQQGAHSGPKNAPIILVGTRIATQLVNSQS